jgi:iron(III)-enterobactin esterase
MTTEQHTITSSCGKYTRDIWLLRGPAGTAQRLSVFLDAEHYIRDMNCIPLIQDLVERRSIPPITCLFVSHHSRDARHRDLICNAEYSRFIAEDTVRWVSERSEDIEKGNSLICGVSLSGLAAVYTALQYPGVFSYSLSQSGSFWWLADKDMSLPQTTARFWLSVGAEETAKGVSHPPTGLFQRVSQIEGVESAARVLESLGATVRYNLFSGGHAFAPWREEFAPALRWLVGGA